MTAELDAKITQCREALEQQRGRAEAALERFFDALTVLLRAWIPEQVRLVVKRNHETTTKLGSERITILKTELEKLVTDIPKLVRSSWLGGKGLWAHRVDFAPTHTNTIHYRIYSSPPPSGPYQLQEPLKKIREHMGAFMAKHGYSQRTHWGSYDFGFFEWSDTLNEPLNRYADEYEAFVKASQALQAAIRAKGEHEANSIWEKS
ncbi:hypothetical protein SCE1572_14015 [Sorangium cellulosum So0157-2]|uniref:Uncharacterized protein n=2 Tax=Sorangium cellulosum TaxID=56 RepID=S4XQT2_SORCE|nr:hypothetical protein SCE1572_14015 [Sorangium cellulosum So0157-2]